MSKQATRRRGKQGDAKGDPTSALAGVTYEDLYRRWEEGNWKATAIDFSKDREGWRSLSEIQRKSALWTYSMFFYGEDSVADNLSPYIDAAPKEGQKYFLTTQQVDEARHAVFFSRFFSDVIGAGEGIASGLAYTEPQLTWGFRQVFDRLDRMADELRRDRSLPKFAQAIALYHMVVEAELAQPGQHFIEDYFVKSGTLPGFAEGMKNVTRDEQRHIGFGVKVLSELFAESEECKQAVGELLREVSPYTLAVYVPPNWDRRYTEEYGFTLEEIYAWGFRSIETKWRAAGFPLEEMPPGVFPIDWSLTPEERVARIVKLMQAGVVGEPNGDPDSSPEIQRLYFDTVERSVDHSAVDGRPVTIQWRFADAAPWHLRIDNGSSRADQGEAPDADLTFETTWADWIAVTTHRGDPRKAMLTGRIRPRGSIRQLLRMPRIFPR
ncbi:MAG TPA: ribonucleotide-diphosphate reductase subunit beta [Solirubrobacterales bacterium]|nr:ribonucleotide-diphosphate reductase subunit beta [Solirubrobacterales bacterium]